MTNNWQRINRINRARFSSVAGYMALFNGSLDSEDEVFITTGSTPPTEVTDEIVSDDFSAATLSDMWTLDNPSGGSVELVTVGDDKALQINVPSGGVDAWVTNTTPHLTQVCGDIDFDITVKFLTEPTGDSQDQGILVELDNNDFIRFDVFHDGTNLRVFVGEVVSGTSMARANAIITTGQGDYLRITRTGTSWLYRRSADGETWSTVLSRTGFTMVVANVGMFAGSATNVYTAQMDYFFDVANPIDPEDGASVTRPEITLGAETVFGAATQALTIDRLAVMDAVSGGNILDSIILPTPMQIGVGNVLSVHHGGAALNEVQL